MPNFLVIGAQRCGTTSLWNLLASHPSVSLPSRKELHYFDDYGGRYSASSDVYADCFHECRESAKAIGEVTPNYLFASECRDRIFAMLPNVKLVVILRNPVERAYSHYLLTHRRGREGKSFEEALRAEPARLANADPESRVSYSYLSRGEYSIQLRRYLALFPRENIHTLFLEELLGNPQESLAALSRFLEIESFQEGRSDVARKNKSDQAPRSLWLLRATKHLQGIAGENAPQKGLRKIGRILAAANKSRRKLQMAEKTRNVLQSHFERFDHDLELLLQRPVPWR